MSQFFNLKKFNLGVLQRFAMGAPAWKGREAFMWWNILDIINGERDPNAMTPPPDGKETPYQSWENLVKVNSSLNALKNKAIQQHKSFQQLYMDRYNVTPLEANNFFAIVVGYHPEFGGYITSVGPYRFKDKKKQKKDEVFRKLDSLNRFAFFTLRAKSCTPESLVKDAAYMRDNNIGRVKDIVELDERKDFAISTTFPDPSQKQKDGDVRGIHLESLDSPEAELLFGPSPAAPEGQSYLQIGKNGVSLNAVGKFKVLNAIAEEYGLQDSLKECIRIVAIKQGITEQQMMQELLSGGNVRKSTTGPVPAGGKKMVTLVSGLFDLMDFVNVKAVAAKDGWADVLSAAIQGVSGGLEEDEYLQQSGLQFQSVEQLSELSTVEKEKREKKSRALFKEIKKIRTAMLKANKVKAKDSPEVVKQKEERTRIANSIFVPNVNILNTQKAGALIFTPVIQVKNHQKAQIDLRLKILKKAAEQEQANPGQPVDLAVIAQSLKAEAEASMTKGKQSFTEWQEQNVSDWVNQIKRELEIEGQPISYSEMYKQVVKKFGAIRSPTARNTYDTWKEAVQNFKIFLMAVDSTQQDKATGAKIITPSAMETLNINVNEANNMSWEELCERRVDNRLTPEELAKIKAEFDSMSAEELAALQKGATSSGLSEEELEELEGELAEEEAPIAPEEVEEVAVEAAEEAVTEEISEEAVTGNVAPVPADPIDFPVVNEEDEGDQPPDFPINEPTDPVLPPVPAPAAENPTDFPVNEEPAVVPTPAQPEADAVTPEVLPPETKKITPKGFPPPKGFPKPPKTKIKDPVASTFNTSLQQLLKIANDLENEGNSQDCEEIHKIIRKYI